MLQILSTADIDGAETSSFLPLFRALLLLDPRFKVESNRINQKFHVQIVLSRCGRMIFRALIIMLHQQHMVALLYPCDTFNTTIDYVLVVFPCTCACTPLWKHLDSCGMN